MTAQKLRQLHIQNFRACVDVRIDFEPSNFIVLLGANMTGKSTIIDALRLLRIGFQADLIDAFRRRGDQSVRTSAMSGALNIRGVLTETSLTAGFEDVDLSIERYRSNHQINSSLEPAIIFLGSTGWIDPKSVDDREREFTARDGIAVMSHSRTVPSYLASASEQGEDPRAPRLKTTMKRIDERGLELGSALATIQRDTPDNWADLMADLQFGFPFVTSFTFPDQIGGRIGIAWKDSRFPTTEFYADHFSDGMLSYLMILAAIHAPEPATVLAFDEPEIGLHPSLLERMIRRLQERADAGTPVLLATHSDRILNFLDDPAASIRICTVDGDKGVQLTQLDPERLAVWREDFSMSQLRERGKIDPPNPRPRT
jgi:predicted ATPase